MPDIDARPSGAALDERVRIVAYIRERAEEVRRKADPPATGVALAAIWSQIADEINTFRDLDALAPCRTCRSGTAVPGDPDGRCPRCQAIDEAHEFGGDRGPR